MEETLKDRLSESNVAPDVYAFMLDRLKGLYMDEGFPPDLFQAVAEVSPDTIADFDLRMRAMDEFRRLPEARNNFV